MIGYAKLDVRAMKIEIEMLNPLKIDLSNHGETASLKYLYRSQACVFYNPTQIFTSREVPVYGVPKPRRARKLNRD